VFKILNDTTYERACEWPGAMFVDRDSHPPRMVRFCYIEVRNLGRLPTPEEAQARWVFGQPEP
jgi:hypothetical protein